MRNSVRPAVIVLAAIVSTVCVIADQDTVILDPAGGARTRWVVDTDTLPGVQALLRDDLFVVPTGHERILCYGSNTVTPIVVQRIRYTIERTGEPDAIVELIDQTGERTGVEVRRQGQTLQQICLHGQHGTCQYTGIPPELFGSIKAGSLQHRVEGTWLGWESGKWYQIQYRPSDDLTCTAFLPL